MRKEIAIYDKFTGKRVYFDTRTKLLKALYSDYDEEYADISEYFANLMMMYKDAPLVKYVPTGQDKARIRYNPDYANDIPEYTVMGYDTAVGDGFSKHVRREFYEKFMNAESKIVDFINSTNKKYVAKIKYVLE